MLQGCKHLCKRTDHSAGKAIKMNTTNKTKHNKQNKTKHNKLHLVIFILGELAASVFEKGTFPPHHEHNVPLTAAAALTCPVQNQRAHGVPLLLTAAAPFQSQPLFQFSRIVWIHWFVPAQPHLQLPTDHIRAALQHWSNVCFIPIRAAQTAA